MTTRADPWKYFYIKGTLFVFFLFPSLIAYSEDQKVLFRDDFNDLNNWKPFHFKKIRKYTSYTIESDGKNKYLKTKSDSSASAIVYNKEFNVYEFPKIRWRWKVDNVYKNGNAKTKKGDDYPIRIYIIFKFDPKKAGFSEKIKYRSIKLIYGAYPPHSSLNYIWANREHEENILTNTYTQKAKMILLQKGMENVGKWLTKEVDIIADYKRAFGEKPPSIASIAVMNDSDNTGEKSVSYIDYIEIYR